MMRDFNLKRHCEGRMTEAIPKYVHSILGLPRHPDIPIRMPRNDEILL